MDLSLKTCTLIVHQFPVNYEIEDLNPKSHVLYIEDWIFKIHLKSETTFKMYPNSDQTPFYFEFKDDVPLKILMKVYNYLRTYRNEAMQSLQNMCLEKLTEVVHNLDCNISKDFSPLFFRSVRSFNKWICGTVQKAIYIS